jgi:hypothetical protein
LLSKEEDGNLAPVQLVAIYVGIFIPIAAFLGVYSAMVGQCRLALSNPR